jgi:aminopeptidase-like protein
VFDWEVPKEWNIRDAYIKNSKGERIVDFQKSNLHVVSYSTPIRATLGLEELLPHLHTLPDRPDWIPYRTTYYKEDWGFCLPHRQLLSLSDDRYEVCIDSTLEPGHLTYGEYYHRGESSEEILLCCHICHPSLCNDNLSGISLLAHLAEKINHMCLRYSYRFLFLPATIGAITWLALNESKVFNVRHGLVVANVGDAGSVTYKQSRRGDAEIDLVVAEALKASFVRHEIEKFSPYGYDERQFCSPGFNLPVGNFMRTPHGRYPEYHTSADNLQFCQAGALGESFVLMMKILAMLEGNGRFFNQNPKCEPQLGKRGLYASLGGQTDTNIPIMALLWVLNLSDGTHSLLDIARKSDLDFGTIVKAAELLVSHDLLKEIDS